MHDLQSKTCTSYMLRFSKVALGWFPVAETTFKGHSRSPTTSSFSRPRLSINIRHQYIPT